MHLKVNSYQYKVIFSDIDGTLLNSQHRVPGDTRKEILKLEQEGVPFVLVSARMPDGMSTIQNEIGNKAPMVCYSGALVKGEDGETLYSRYMDSKTALEIKDLLDRKYPDICCNTYGDSLWAVDDDGDPWVVKEEAITSLKSVKISVREMLERGQGIHKLLLMGQPDSIARVKEHLKREYPDLSIATSSQYYLEVMDGGVKKSVGASFLCGYYGITMDQAIAFGDGGNDVDMLAAVKNSYAMANAPREVRDSAAHVTLDNDHEGLLAALKENFT